MAVPDVGEAVRGNEHESFIEVAVNPSASSSQLSHYDRWRRRIVVRVAAPPVKGEANRALVSLFASLLGVSKGDVNIVRGGNSREKTLHVKLPRDVVLEKLQERL